MRARAHVRERKDILLQCCSIGGWVISGSPAEPEGIIKMAFQSLGILFTLQYLAGEGGSQLLLFLFLCLFLPHGCSRGFAMTKAKMQGYLQT